MCARLRVQPVLYALKFQTPASERDYVTKWDFVMVRRLTARLPPAFQASICPAHSVHLYDDEVRGLTGDTDAPRSARPSRH